MTFERSDRATDFTSGIRFIRREPGRQVDRRSAAGTARGLRRRRRRGRGICRPGRSSSGSGTAHDVNEVAFSPDGEYLVTASWDGTAKIVDRSGRVIRVLPEDGVVSVRGPVQLRRPPGGYGGLSPNGRVPREDLGLGARRGRPHDQRRRVREWTSIPAVPGSRRRVRGTRGDLGRGERNARGGARTGTRGAFTVSPSAPTDRASPPRVDGTVRLFEADTGAQQLVLRGFDAPSRVAFSPDGTKLASASACGGVRIWALDIDDLLRIAHREVPRALTDEECRQYLHVDQCPQSEECLAHSLALPRGSPNRIDVATVQRSRSVDRTPGAVDPTLGPISRSSRIRPANDRETSRNDGNGWSNESAGQEPDSSIAAGSVDRPREHSQGGDTGSNPVGTTSKAPGQGASPESIGWLNQDQTPDIPQISRAGSSVASARK